MKILTLVVYVLIFTCVFVRAKPKKQKYIIVGAGPVGLYLSNELLKLNTTEKVTVYESRNSFIRPQCLRLPFAIAKNFPEEIKRNLWPIESIRETLFKDRVESDKDFEDFWPSPGYQHFPRISVGNLQSTFIDYLKNTFDGKFSLEFKEKTKGVTPKDIINEYGSLGNEVDMIFVTSGNGDLNKDLRNDLGNLNNIKLNATMYDFSTNGNYRYDGIYLIYNNTDNGKVILENYQREYSNKSQYMNRAQLSKDGITYSATNNKYGMVQVYTYDVGAKFESLYKKLPQSVRNSAGWIKFINYKSGKTESFKNVEDQIKRRILEKDVEIWTKEFRNHLDNLLNKYKIDVPADAKLHWAPRLQYAYKETHSYNKNKIPVVFAGDAMGGTDYKYGLNLGRGLYEVDQLIKFLKINTGIDDIDVQKILGSYQTYWNDVVAQEFGDPLKKLSDEHSIFYKYVIMGRSVNGRVLGSDMQDLQFYIEAINSPKK